MAAMRKRPIRRVAVYARRSQSDERAGSVPGQIRRCKERAAAEGWEVAWEFKDDGISGYQPSRRIRHEFNRDDPGRTSRADYEQLLEAIAGGDVDAVLVDKDDRLFRQDVERLRFSDYCERAGVWYIGYSAGGGDDLTTADGRKAFRDRGSGAQHFSERLSERATELHDELAAGGYWPGGGRPYGFDVIDLDDHKTLQVREDEAESLRSAYAAVIAGRSLKGIAREMNSDGRRTARGGLWSGNSLKQTLLAPRNIGKRIRGGEIVGNAKWPAIVSKGTFDKVTAILTDSDRQKHRRRGNDYLLSGGLLRCEDPDHRPMAGRPSRGVRRYICQDAGAHSGIDAKKLEDYVGDLASLMAVAQVVVRDPATVAAPIRAELDEVEAKITAWNREAAAAGLPAAEIVEGRKPLADRRAQLEAELDELATVTKAPILWKRDEVGRYADEWRAMIELRVDRVIITSVARGTNQRARFEDRVRIVWREGVRELPLL